MLLTLKMRKMIQLSGIIIFNPLITKSSLSNDKNPSVKIIITKKMSPHPSSDSKLSHNMAEKLPPSNPPKKAQKYTTSSLLQRLKKNLQHFAMKQDSEHNDQAPSERRQTW